MRVRTHDWLASGQVIVCADYEHPEAPVFEFGWGPGGVTASAAPVPDGRILYCHPDDERRVRDRIAVAAEMGVPWP